MKRALITGITGQDGSFLAELLLEKGYEVFGFSRRDSWFRPNCSSHLVNRVQVLFGDMAEGVDIAKAILDSEPDEVYNLASQSRTDESWARPAETLVVNGLGAIRLFEALRHHRPKCRVYHASSCEMFGQALETPQNEHTPFNPVNPYAAVRVYTHHMVRIYRGSYGLHIASGVLFNHESERRPLHFVSQKIAYGAACARLGIADSPAMNERGRPVVEKGKLALGNLGVARDWGYAGDFVRAMWQMLQADRADDFVIGTGKLHTLRDLCDIAYRSVGFDWRDSVVSDPALVRPLESSQLLADARKARRELGWEPTVTFEAMVERMVAAQIGHLQSNRGKE